MPLKRAPNRKRLTVDLEMELYQQFKIYCVLKDTNMADEMRKMIQRAVKQAKH